MPTGASLFFFAVYCHIFRGIYYGSYKAPREITWIIGVLIFISDDGTAFMGYINCPGADVVLGRHGDHRSLRGDPAGRARHSDLAARRAGGRQPDANRFFFACTCLPFVIAGTVVVHIWAFHTTGNNNPTGVGVRRGSKAGGEKDTLPFWPYFVIKDLYALVFVLVIFSAIVGFMPNFLSHPDNYVEANALQTPAHIVPEWYFLPFYAMLRAITFDIWFIDSEARRCHHAMFGSIILLVLLPWLDTSRVRSGRYRPRFKIWFWIPVLAFMLMWCGSQPLTALPDHQPARHALLVRLLLVILPLLGVLEKPLTPPASIEADFAAHYGPAEGETRLAAVKPAE